MIKINIDKAKEIHKEKLRAARQPLLDKLDVEFTRALETGADTSEIVKKKQELRDVTNHPDLKKIKTPEKLKEFWPEILEG
jgi:hypothetical protein